jgi:hypothetical protein
MDDFIKRIIESKTALSSLGVGIIVGSLLTLILLALAMQLLTRDPQRVTPNPQSGLPNVTIALRRDALQHLIDDALHDVSIPFITFRDPYVQLEPDALLVLRLRGDTLLLGGQTIALRMRVVPMDQGVGVVTESAKVEGRLNIPAALIQRLDQLVNAELARRLPFTEQIEVLNVGGTSDELIIEARLQGRS